MARVTLKLDTRKNSIKKDGTYPIIIELSHKNKSGRISLKYSVNIEDWDPETCTLKNVPNFKLITAKLQSLFSRADSYLKNNNIGIDSMSNVELTNRIKADIFSSEKTTSTSRAIFIAKRINQASLIDFGHQKLSRLKASGKNGYLTAIETGLTALRRFFNRMNEDILFAEIDLVFLKNFSAYCIGRGQKSENLILEHS